VTPCSMAIAANSAIITVVQRPFDLLKEVTRLVVVESWPQTQRPRPHHESRVSAALLLGRQTSAQHDVDGLVEGAASAPCLGPQLGRHVVIESQGCPHIMMPTKIASCCLGQEEIHCGRRFTSCMSERRRSCQAFRSALRRRCCYRSRGSRVMIRTGAAVAVRRLHLLEWLGNAAHRSMSQAAGLNEESKLERSMKRRARTASVFFRLSIADRK
jgi:hypothetical protein